MSQQLINVGTVANDHTGDTVRTALQKANANFTELYAGGRQLITSNTTFYVRTDGSNSNDGTANTAGGAWLTLQYALGWIAAHCVILSPAEVTVQLATGTYSNGTVFPPRYFGSGRIVIQGDMTTPANVIITSASSFTMEFTSGCYYKIQGVTLNGVTHILRVKGQGNVEVSTVRFGNSGPGSHILVSSGGLVEITGPYTITSGGACHWQIDTGSSVRMFNQTVTLTGTPAFANAFCQVLLRANLYVAGNTFSGAATGQRYNIQFNSIVYTNGAGATHFPGNVAGAASAGGLYA